jgi:hypothetical protein
MSSKILILASSEQVLIYLILDLLLVKRINYLSAMTPNWEVFEDAVVKFGRVKINKKN